MYDHQLFLRTLSEFTHVLLTPYEVEAVLPELADRVTEVLGLEGSGVSLAQEGRLEFDTAHGDSVAAIEEVQQATQRGPCVSAVRTGADVVVPDLDAEATRWPEYCRAARDLGLRSVASVPLALGGRTFGALNMYGKGARSWGSDDLAAARILADMATAYLVNASHHRMQVELNAQLQHALDSRLVIEQAKGMLAARRGISPEEAFELLRGHARSHQSTVRSLAQAVVSLGLDL